MAKTKAKLLEELGKIDLRIVEQQATYHISIIRITAKSLGIKL
jgi:hypothetical protein